jgi:hypothetical protein
MNYRHGVVAGILLGGAAIFACSSPNLTPDLPSTLDGGGGPDGTMADAMGSDSAVGMSDSGDGGACTPQPLKQLTASVIFGVPGGTAHNNVQIFIDRDKYWTGEAADDPAHLGGEFPPQLLTWGPILNTDYGYIKSHPLYSSAPLNSTCNCKPWEGAGVTGAYQSGTGSYVILISNSLYWRYTYAGATWTSGSLSDIWATNPTLTPDAGAPRHAYDAPGVTTIAPGWLGNMDNFGFPSGSTAMISVVNGNLRWELQWGFLPDGGLNDTYVWNTGDSLTDVLSPIAFTAVGGQASPLAGPGITAAYPGSIAYSFNVVSVDKVWTLHLDGNPDSTTPGADGAGMLADDPNIKKAPIIPCP